MFYPLIIKLEKKDSKISIEYLLVETILVEFFRKKFEPELGSNSDADF